MYMYNYIHCADTADFSNFSRTTDLYNTSDTTLILCENVTLIDDELVEGVEDLTVSVSTISGPVMIATQNYTTVTILDNDCELLSMHLPAYVILHMFMQIIQLGGSHLPMP